MTKAKKKQYDPEDDWPENEEPDDYDPEYSHARPCQNTIKNKPEPNEQKLIQITLKTAKLAKELKKIEKNMNKADKQRQKWQKQLDTAFSKAKSSRNGTAARARQEQANNPTPKRANSKEKKPAPGNTLPAKGKIQTMVWTPKKRLIQTTTTTPETETTKTKWIPNQWQPKT